MRHLDLFSGIGGFALAARWMGWTTIQFVEKDSYCQKVLNKNFKGVPVHGDIKTFDGTRFRSANIITGGFPCQPFSVAGRRMGKEDDRYLWPEMLRVIAEAEPTYVVGENVSGSIQVVDEICADLENIGYTAEPVSLEAGSIGADHKRERLWFMAYSNSIGLQGSQLRMQKDKREGNINAALLPPLSFQRERTKDYIPKPYVVGGADGIPNRMDRTRALGNAIVPGIAYKIFKAIESTS